MALAYGGQTERTVLPEESGTLDAELLQEEETEAKAKADRVRPGLTMFTDGSRLDNGATGYAVVWKGGLTWAGVEGHMRGTKRPVKLSAPLSPGHWRRHREETRDPGTGHNLLGCPGSHQADGVGRTRTGSMVRPPGKEAHRHAAQGEAGHCHRNSMVPSPQGSRRQREG